MSNILKLNSKISSYQPSTGSAFDSLSTNDICHALGKLGKAHSLMLKYKYIGINETELKELHKEFTSFVFKRFPEVYQYKQKDESNCIVSRLSLLALKEFAQNCKRCKGACYVFKKNENNVKVSKICDKCKGTGRYQGTSVERGKLTDMTNVNFADNWKERFEKVFLAAMDQFDYNAELKFKMIIK